MDLGTIKKIHFIGIGGIGMSALARHFLAEGKQVSGSDRAPSPITDALVKEGVQFFSPQITDNIASDINLVVYTEAMAHDHEEMVAARKLAVPMMNYFEALGLVANQYFVIAVAGAHGKSTTTAMLIDIFEDAGLDPSAVVGALRGRSGSNYRRGKGKYFIVEACEYKRDFLSLEPDILVITNIEAEHLDYYKDLDDVVDAFHELALKVREGGAIICNTKDPNSARAIEGVSAKVVDYTKQIDLLSAMKQPGMHNRMNAAAARTAALEVGISRTEIDASIAQFAGTWRRFEYKGTLVSGALVYDDYGHHPTEIMATIAGARELYPDKKILLVYQPHTYSRTHMLFDDFADALSKADEVVLLPIYAARESNESGVASDQLVRRIGVSAQVVDTLEDSVRTVLHLATKDHVVLVMGAGDIYKVAEMLLV